MKNIHRILALLTLLLCFCISTTAYAEITPSLDVYEITPDTQSTLPSIYEISPDTQVSPSFSDTNLDTTYYNTTNNVTPDILIEAVANRLNLPADLDTLVKYGCITPTEKSWYFENNEAIPAAVIWRILLPVYDILPYPAEYYKDTFPQLNYDSPYDAARIAALSIGVTPFYIETPGMFYQEAPSIWYVYEESPNMPMEVSRFYSLIDKLEAGDYTPLEPPIPLPQSITKTTWSYKNYEYRNSLLMAESRIPTEWLDDFRTSEWKVILQDQPKKLNYTDVSYFKYMNSRNAIGLTCYDDKVIYLTEYSFDTFIHELAHYLAERADLRSSLYKYYGREAYKASSVLRKYAQTNPDEYFAVFVEDWYYHPEHRNKLTAKAPRTATLINELSTNFSSFISQPATKRHLETEVPFTFLSMAETEGFVIERSEI